MKRIEELTGALEVPTEAWEPVGRYVAKIDPAHLAANGPPRRARIVLVTGMTPTSAGVGKTVSTLGLVSGMTRLGLRAIACLRQPSLGPVFGIKGGGAGGGHSTVEPRDLVNLGLTGDLDAVTNAHNLLASLLDNALHHGNDLGIDPASIAWPRAMDLEDRSLREITLGLGAGNGPTRPGGFVITPASEVTAILGLAQGYGDLRKRLGNIVVARDRSGRPVRARDLRAEGAMSVLLRRALLPNLLQTQDGAPVLVHGGPFGNLSYGTTTLASLHVAQRLADVVLVEAGFGSDLGAEKFVDLVAPLGDVAPVTSVLVTSLPTIRAHAGSPSGHQELGPGLENLTRHVEILRRAGLETVVAVNRFPGDTPAELQQLHDTVASLGVLSGESTAYATGGEGSVQLAQTVWERAKGGHPSQPVYDPKAPPLTKMQTLATEVYGAEGVDLDAAAQQQLSQFAAEGFGEGPICSAKTQLSLSDDPHRLGRPRGFRVRVRGWIPQGGAGYLVALLGDIRTMPGLPREPRAFQMSLDETGRAIGVE